jgi:hypothetical protein
MTLIDSKNRLIGIFVLGTLGGYLWAIISMLQGETSTVVAWSTEIIILGIPIIVLWYAIKVQGLSLTELGLTFRMRGERRILIAIMVIATYPVVVVVVSMVSKTIIRSFLPEDLGALSFRESIGPSSLQWQIAIAIGFAVYAGLIEEIFFRGLLRLVINTKPLFILLSSVLFSVYHWSAGIPIMLNAFVMGLVFSTIVVHTGSLLPAVVSHTLLDLVVLVGDVLTGQYF